MELIRKKMRLEIKTTYFNNEVIEPLIVMSLFEDGELYEHERVLNEIVDSKLVFVNQHFPFNLKKDWYYTIKKICSTTTFIDFLSVVGRTEKRERGTILKSVYNVIMAVETRE